MAAAIELAREPPAALRAHPLVARADPEDVFNPAGGAPPIGPVAGRLLEPLLQAPAVLPLVGAGVVARFEGCAAPQQLVQAAIHLVLRVIHAHLLILDIMDLALNVLDHLR